MANTEPQMPPSSSKPVRFFGLVLAILVAVQGYIAVIETIPNWVKLVVGGLIIVILAGLTFWTEGQTVPWKNTVARYVDKTATVVSGPAAELVAGVEPNQPVQVSSLPPA